MLDYTVSMPMSPNEKLLQRVCEIIRHQVDLQGLADDDVLHCAAAAHALTALGVPSTLSVASISYEEDPAAPIQIAYLVSSGRFWDIRGNEKQTDGDLEMLRTQYLIQRYGMKRSTVDFISADVSLMDVFWQREPGFQKEYEHLATQAVALVRGENPPEPLGSDPKGSIRNGPLSRSNYARKIRVLLESSNVHGLENLLEAWKDDSDLDRPANLPQQLVAALASSSRTGYGFASGEIVGLVKKARQYGADIHHVSSRGDNLVHTAAQFNHDELLGYLLKEGVAIDLSPLPANCTLPPLAHAIINNHPLVVRLLIDAGADINFAGSTGETPLCAAARAGNIELMDDLLSRGADIFVCNQSNENMLHMVCGTHFESPDKKAAVVRKLLDEGVSHEQLSNRHERPQDCLEAGDDTTRDLLVFKWPAHALSKSTALPTSARSTRRTL